MQLIIIENIFFSLAIHLPVTQADRLGKNAVNSGKAHNSFP